MSDFASEYDRGRYDGCVAGEKDGAARAVEQCRRLAEEAAAEAPNGWMREALERFAASLARRR